MAERFDDVRFTSALRELFDDAATGAEKWLFSAENDDEEYGLLVSEATVTSVRSYEEVGMLTRDAGLLVKLSDGTKFALTVQEYGGSS